MVSIVKVVAVVPLFLTLIPSPLPAFIMKLLAVVSTSTKPPPELTTYSPWPKLLFPVGDPAAIVPELVTVTFTFPVPLSSMCIACAPDPLTVLLAAISIETDKLFAVAFDTEIPSPDPVTLSFISRVAFPPLVRRM